jgi:hypothetical protein
MLRSQEFSVQKAIAESGGLSQIDESIKLIQEYLTKEYHPSKNKRLVEWNPDKGEIYEIVLAAFTLTLIHHSLTYQAICGMMACRFDLDDHVDRIKTAAEVIALISKTGLINVTRSGSGTYILISTGYQLDDIPDFDSHEIITRKPHRFTANYDEEFGSLILGGKHNHHEDNICLDHLNRMNAIQLKLNRPFLRKYEEAPTFALDTQKKADQWQNFVTGSYRTYIKLVRGGNRFHLVHRYDKRGRCYAEGYHVNTQGSSFKKAVVQLAQTEIVEMET